MDRADLSVLEVSVSHVYLVGGADRNAAIVLRLLPNDDLSCLACPGIEVCEHVEEVRKV